MVEDKNNNINIPEVRVSAIGNAKNPVYDDEPVEYGGGVSGDPMDELAAEDTIPEQPGVVVELTAKRPESMSEAMMGDEESEKSVNIPPKIGENIDEDKIRTDPNLTVSDKPAFNPDSVQSPLVSEKIEGGVIKNRSTGPTMSESKSVSNGELLKPKPNMEKDSLINKYEVTGFSVEYEAGNNTHSVVIRDYFNDLETAFASVNSNKYLMPMPGGGFKIATISDGAPTISYNERQVYNYKDGKWYRDGRLVK